MPRLEVRKRFIRFSVILGGTTLVGTLGFMLIEGWSIVDALYMTVITLSTVGFGEVHPLSEAGQMFTAGLIMAGVVAVMYLFGAISQYIISGELTGSLRARHMQSMIGKLQGHFIICGFGRVGQRTALDLIRRDRQCVVVDNRTDLGGNDDDELFYVTGDVTDDEALETAGIARAAGLVAATGDDATNLFVTLSARALNPDLCVVARVNDPANESKLERAGATHVVSPYAISGRRIAAQLLYPSVADFLDTVMQTESLDLSLEEYAISDGSDLFHRTVADAEIRGRTGANVLAIRRAEDGRLLTNPPEDMRLETGDILIALGTNDQLRALAQVAGTDRTRTQS